MFYLLLAIVICVTTVILVALIKGQDIHKIEISSKSFKAVFGKRKVGNVESITDLEKE